MVPSMLLIIQVRVKKSEIISIPKIKTERLTGDMVKSITYVNVMGFCSKLLMNK